MSGDVSVVGKTQYPSSLKLLCLCSSDEVRREVVACRGRPVQDVGRRSSVDVLAGVCSQSETAEWCQDESCGFEAFADVGFVDDQTPCVALEEGLGEASPGVGDGQLISVESSCGESFRSDVSDTTVCSFVQGSGCCNLSSSCLSGDAVSMFSRNSSSSVSTAFDEQRFLGSLPDRDMTGIGIFCMTKYPFVAAHRTCSHTLDDYKGCPRCGRVCVREFGFSDAVVCVWCFYEGLAVNSCWFCWRCAAETGGEGIDDSHFVVWRCSHGRSD